MIEPAGLRAQMLGSLLLVAWAGASPAAPPKCPVSEKMLLGAWTSEAPGFFEEMEFEASGSSRTFNSWLHQRPEISGGSWKLENCTLHVRHRTEGTMSFAFTYVRVRGDRLYLREAGDKESAVYRRVKP